MQKRMILIKIALLAGYTALIVSIAVPMQNPHYMQTALHQSQITITAGMTEGTIYDRNFQPLVNQKMQNYAFVTPSESSVHEVLFHTKEILPVLKALKTGKPFCCRVDIQHSDHPDIIILQLPERYSDDPPAQHLLGYTLEHTGITGLESDYDTLLRKHEDDVSVMYSVDALGKLLPGADPVIHPAEYKNSGVVTTLDIDIQRICEKQKIQKGAIVVMDITSGDILAMASFPDYTPQKIGEAISSQDSPLINRCLYAYSVGSIFKLMTCATAYTQGLKSYLAECTGSTEIKNQVFRCHKLDGHGLLDMKQAVTTSCNTYFVQLSTLLQPALMRETAQNFGFGTQIPLTHSIISSAGTLPSIRDLNLPAEMANFCFGQGLLTATPLQITQMTCGIANNGNMPVARLIRGITDDAQHLNTEEPAPRYAKALKQNASYFLQNLMVAAINENPNSKAVPDTVFAAGKTSTAQTGRYDENGIEYCHAWITGYFPIDQPKYAVTVLAEDGGYGNDAAAPVFKNIADQITALHSETE